MSGIKKRWLGNSVVNLVGGVATAGVNLLLPALVVKYLSAESFSVWNLALQMMVYVNLLSMGLQTATARAVAHGSDAGDEGVSNLTTIVRAARSISRWASLAALLLIAVLVAVYPAFFPDVAGGLLADFRITIAIFGLAAVTQILAQVDMGVFQGLHQNSVFVGVQVLVRLLTLGVVGVGVLMGQPMVALAAMMAFASTMLWPGMRLAFKFGVPWSGDMVNKIAIDLAQRRDLLRYCGSLSVWSVSMLLVNAVGIVLVGRWDFSAVGPYAIAMTAVAVLVGLLNAALSPLLTTSAALFANPATRAQLPRLLMRTTLAAAVLLNLLALAVTILHPFILKHWVGESFVSSAGPLMVVLVAAHCLRNIAAPYSLMLLATGMHRRALLSAMLEGACNLIASVAMGVKWGALGVAGGTLIGAFVGLAGTLVINIRKTPVLAPNPIRFSVYAVVMPMMVFAPMHYLVLRATL
jgi:O-antigen/teichoic acid export membrane protein